MKDKIKIKYIKTAFGELILGEYNSRLCLSDWRYRKMRGAIDKRIQVYFNCEYIESNSELLVNAEKQLDEYFKKERNSFDIPFITAGTDFQKKVWEELREIPYGQTETYLGLAGKLGDKKAVRAVATANGANALSIFIPCHRIIGSNHQLIGYAGGVAAKKKLLQLEGALPQLELF